MQRPRSRLGAFLVHFIISVLVLLAFSAVVFFCWFPGALFSLAGGWEGFRIVAVVDLVLGPSLTLIVYNVSKPLRELVRDLSIIATIQVVCLLAGMYTVYYSRPLVVVHVFDTFYVFNREALKVIGASEQEIDKLSGLSPKKRYVAVPFEKMEFLNQHVKSLINGEKPLQQRLDLYKELPRGTEVLGLLHGVLEADGKCVRLDIESPYKKGTVCFDPESQRFTGFLPN